jgi:murein DD-endopeptidase MepM/ murein hydrolase activator NlpD
MKRALVMAALGTMALLAGARMPAPAPETPPAIGADGLPPPRSLVLPVLAPVLTQGYGCTDFELEPVNPFCPGRHFHAGLDLAAPLGTLVRAAAAGTVVTAAWNESGYGLCMVIDHGQGLTTLYAHLLETAVVAGDSVSAGQPIAQVGSTGNSTGPHLHFEVRSDGRPVDPELFLPAAHQRGGSP